MSNAPFYVVWNPDRGPPTVRHDTFRDAQSEARRLAKHAPGERFYVLAAVSFVHVQDPVTVTMLGKPHIPDLRQSLDDDIPF